MRVKILQFFLFFLKTKHNNFLEPWCLRFLWRNWTIPVLRCMSQCLSFYLRRTSHGLWRCSKTQRKMVLHRVWAQTDCKLFFFFSQIYTCPDSRWRESKKSWNHPLAFEAYLKILHMISPWRIQKHIDYQMISFISLKAVK